MDHHIGRGTIFGGILLVAGCCIGAGMLGLPVLTAAAGFKPSLFMFVICWGFMVATGLLLLEVNLWFTEEVSIVTMAERTLGVFGKIISWVVFLFLFYSLMVAYAAGSGALVADFIAELTGSPAPPWVGSLLISLLFGILVYAGTHAVDRFNRLLMFGLIAAYAVLIVLGGKYVKAEYLEHQDWSQIGNVIPVMIVSFGFHNLIPSLTTYLRGNVKALRWTIILGSAIPLVIYLVWEWLILGIVPLEGEQGFYTALNEGEMATQVLRSVVGTSWVLSIAEAFSFFAIITSFLGVALSFVDFLADGLKVKKTAIGKALLCLMAIFPPFLCALIYPSAFLIALNYAGGFGAVILFGILPALMAWQGRYSDKLGLPELIPGGRVVLVMIILFAIGVMAFQLM